MDSGRPPMRMPGLRVNTKPAMITAVVLLAAAVVFYALVDPLSPFMPHCMFKMLTGYDCPGCGAQRCIHALLHGDIAGAWNYNPAMFVLLPLLALYGASETGLLHHNRLDRYLYHPLTMYLLAAAIVMWWILRNL